MMPVDRGMYKGGSIRLTGTVRGCEPEIMKMVGWPYPRPWMFEVRAADRRVIAVCLDYETADQALLDFIRSEQGGA